MYISNQELPSKGLFSREGGTNIEIKPLTFKQLLDYIENVEINPIAKLRKDLNLLASTGVDLYKVSLLDMDYLIFMLKSITISDDIKFNSSTKCYSCDQITQFSFNLSQIHFKDFDTEENRIPSKINIGGEMRKIRVPSIGEFLSVLDTIYKFNPEVKLAQIKLYSLFDEWFANPTGVQNMVDNANRESAANLIYLDDKCFGRIEPVECKCVNCGQVQLTNIDVLTITENFFTDFLRHFRPNESQVLFE